MFRRNLSTIDLEQLSKWRRRDCEVTTIAINQQYKRKTVARNTRYSQAFIRECSNGCWLIRQMCVQNVEAEDAHFSFDDWLTGDFIWFHCTIETHYKIKDSEGDCIQVMVQLWRIRAKMTSGTQAPEIALRRESLQKERERWQTEKKR